MALYNHFWEHFALVMVLFALALSVFANQDNVVGGAIGKKSSAEKTWCQDSDNGLTYNTKGIVKDSQDNVFIDLCKGSSMITEGYCSENHLTLKEYSCLCLDGACLLENSGRKRFFR